MFLRVVNECWLNTLRVHMCVSQVARRWDVAVRLVCEPGLVQ